MVKTFKMMSIVSRIMTILLIAYFFTCFITVLDLFNSTKINDYGYYHLFQKMYLVYILSLVTLLICTWKQKRTTIYFLIMVSIIIYNYYLILTNQVINVVPEFFVNDPFYLLINGHDGFHYTKLLREENNIHLLIPYYLLLIVVISLLIDYIISQFIRIKKMSLVILKVCNVLAVSLIIYFISCILVIKFNLHQYNLIKLFYMYYIYIGGLIVFLIFQHKVKLSIKYFLLILILITYNYSIILTSDINHGLRPAVWWYWNQFLKFDVYDSFAYIRLIEREIFYAIAPYIPILIGMVYMIIDYIVVKIKKKSI